MSGRILKIRYRQADVVQKAKGRLLMNLPDSVILIPFRRKGAITTFSIDSVVSITPWRRKEKIEMAWVAGGGLAALGLAFAMAPSANGAVEDASIASLLLLGVTGAAMIYVAVALPATFLGGMVVHSFCEKGLSFFH